MAKISKLFRIFCIFYAGVLNVHLEAVQNGKRFQDFNLTSVEIIRKYGYPAELHHVQTEDGYILELHRIPHGKFSDSKHGVPLLLGHGLLGSSFEFLLLESESLAFVLADAGYDVWMSNFRGSTYSRNHTSLSPEDKEYWDFSWHEIGMYDIPAFIDYICEFTQRDQLLYIGHSMGTTAYFVTASMRPEYQLKLRGAVLLAPTAYLKHAKTPLRVFAPFSKTFKGLYELIWTGGVFEQTPELRHFIKVLCTPQFFCKNFLFLMAGRNSQGFENKVLPKAVMQLPAGTSIKTAAHFGQLVMSGKFQQYDYGITRNLKEYNQPIPPIYKLEAITVPLSMFIAPNDVFTTERDLLRLLQRLHSVENIYVVPSPKFTHIDFVTAKNIKRLVYDELLKEIEYLIRHKTAPKNVKRRPKVDKNKIVYNAGAHNQIDCSKVDCNAFNHNKMDKKPVDHNEVVYNEADYHSVDQNEYDDYIDADYNLNNYNDIDYNTIEHIKVDYYLH